MPTGNLKGFLELSNVLMGDLQLCIRYKCKRQGAYTTENTDKKEQKRWCHAKIVTCAQCPMCMWSETQLKSI